MSASEVQTNSIYANTNGKFHYPFSSPVGELMTLDQINVKGGAYQGTPADLVSWLLMVNHTLYVYVRSFLEANELVFMDRNSAQQTVPKEILDVTEFIEKIFNVKKWKPLLDKKKPELDAWSKKFSKKYKQDDAEGNEAKILDTPAK
jgi:hypothetical protein